jgi:hypothetical protein
VDPPQGQEAQAAAGVHDLAGWEVSAKPAPYVHAQCERCRELLSRPVTEAERREAARALGIEDWLPDPQEVLPLESKEDANA